MSELKKIPSDNEYKMMFISYTATDRRFLKYNNDAYQNLFFADEGIGRTAVLGIRNATLLEVIKRGFKVER